MSKVLTQDADLECPHKGGVTIVIPPAPRRKLTVKGAAVLMKNDLENAAIGTPVCPQPAQTIDTKIASVTGGEAQRLTVSGKGVLLDTTFAAQTDRSAAISVGLRGAGQSKLTAK